VRSAGGGSRIIPIVPLGLVVGTVFLYFVAGTDSGVDSTWIRLLSAVLTAAAFGIWAWVAWRDPRWRPTSVLWPAIVVVLLAFALSTVLSENGRISRDYLAYAVILAGLYLLLRLVLADGRLRPWIPGTVVVLTYTLAVFDLLLVLAQWIRWWLLVGGPALPPLNPAGEALGLGDSGAVAAIAVLGLAIAARTSAPRRGRRGSSCGCSPAWSRPW
jgi:hypothetical protein